MLTDNFFNFTTHILPLLLAGAIKRIFTDKGRRQCFDYAQQPGRYPPESGTLSFSWRCRKISTPATVANL
ncbi:hypothetical protein [Nostoc sp. NMS4]|uniref:hypothetical protein n=1 Tax=Nostoc sp. NMS4 TaxID=2815390 RepID=UPI0025FFAD09|nr:hypothetical protein [Nostoc sp. NMS4]MBN3925850.1 hypothetical protein [Nostoc sp. NMS4]